MKLRFMVVQIDMAERPPVGSGVLHPVAADGYYDTQQSAQDVADYLARKSPHLRTHVVEVKS